MFHLYFGAFDLVLYLGGTYFAIALSKALCDQMEVAETAQTVTTATAASTTETEIAPMQPIAPHLAAPVAKREEVSVRVSVG